MNAIVDREKNESCQNAPRKLIDRRDKAVNKRQIQYFFELKSFLNLIFNDI